MILNDILIRVFKLREVENISDRELRIVREVQRFLAPVNPPYLAQLTQ